LNSDWKTLIFYKLGYSQLDGKDRAGVIFLECNHQLSHSTAASDQLQSWPLAAVTLTSALGPRKSCVSRQVGLPGDSPTEQM